MAQHPSRSVETEHRWPAVIAILVALGLYALLPGSFFPELRYVVVAVGLILLVPIVVLNPRRLNRETRWSRMISIALGLLLLAANSVALVVLLSRLLAGGDTDSVSILIAGFQVWLTNVIAFALIYWELDRGGPVARRMDARAGLPLADFMFPQDQNGDAIVEVAKGSSAKSDWMPGYVDYLYFSLSNSIAFSPTDVMPLTHRAKLLMAVHALTSFVTLALVIARAVNILN
ncbi:DUF1345 domain-containing protein [Naasia lichenicola]|uniref:DUF1345 domain-containing protein n=1 Tax=Naasia lichenicola TaxID=2565933 RepID=A0A4V3WTQ4_9MICO|nr:DUF1345 domain-containing protein [Naasia lichenicola]THG32887.1 DUF1345 domain-containing protein [Naasia lichenicola]